MTFTEMICGTTAPCLHVADLLPYVIGLLVFTVVLVIIYGWSKKEGK